MININHLSHRYPGSPNPALHDINLHIGAGETFGLLGPNGAGKTTLMSLLAGLHPIQHGNITFDGISFNRLDRQRRQQFSLVPQDFAFYPQLSVWDNLKFFAALYAQRDPAHLHHLLAQTGLDEHRRKRAAHLSGGLKRRLNFAIGLINRPRLLFLDEITVGIDPQSRQFILDSVAALARDGVTILYTSHYLQEIEQLCQRIAILHRGRLRHHGTLNDIVAGNRHQLQLRTEPPLSSAEYDALSHASPNDIAAILANLQQRGYRITACHFGPPSLERFYLDFLQHETDDDNHPQEQSR